MRTTRTSLFAYVAVASLGVAATSLTASDALAGPLCGRAFGGGLFSGPRTALPVVPSYRQKVVVHRPSHPRSKPVALAAQVKAAPRKPISAPEHKLASTAGAATAAQAAGTANPAPPAHATACLSKQYLETGAVMFKDGCTNEWAINSTTAAGQAASTTGGACLTKENHPNGVVMFRDTCTNEWAMNTAERLAGVPPAR